MTLIPFTSLQLNVLVSLEFLLNDVCFLPESLKHLEQNYPGHLVAGQSVQLVEVTPRAKRAFETMMVVVVGLALAKTQLHLAVQPNRSLVVDSA